MTSQIHFNKLRSPLKEARPVGVAWEALKIKYGELMGSCDLVKVYEFVKYTT